MGVAVADEAAFGVEGIHLTREAVIEVAADHIESKREHGFQGWIHGSDAAGDLLLGGRLVNRVEGHVQRDTAAEVHAPAAEHRLRFVVLVGKDLDSGAVLAVLFADMLGHHFLAPFLLPFRLLLAGAVQRIGGDFHDLDETLFKFRNGALSFEQEVEKPQHFAGVVAPCQAHTDFRAGHPAGFVNLPVKLGKRSGFLQFGLGRFRSGRTVLGRIGAVSRTKVDVGGRVHGFVSRKECGSLRGTISGCFPRRGLVSMK